MGAEAGGAPPGVVGQTDRLVIQLVARVSDAIAGATLALVRRPGGDEDDRHRRLRDRCPLQGDRAARRGEPRGELSPAELRDFIDVLRLLPELERSGDLAEHIARRGIGSLSSEMSARSRGLVERMGEVASAMWRTSADAYGDGALDVGARLEERDDEMDGLHDDLAAELEEGQMTIPVVIELNLIGRFYERLGDHVVNLAKRVPARALSLGDLFGDPAVAR